MLKKSLPNQQQQQCFLVACLQPRYELLVADADAVLLLSVGCVVVTSLQVAQLP